MPVELVVPVVGPAYLSTGRELVTRELAEFDVGSDPEVMPPGLRAERQIRAAARDGQVLCVRPLGPSLACVGLSLAEAIDLAYHTIPRIVAVDPYDADGAPIRFGRTDLRSLAAERRPVHPTAGRRRGRAA